LGRYRFLNLQLVPRQNCWKLSWHLSRRCGFVTHKSAGYFSMAISWGTAFSDRHTYHIKWFNSVRLISPLFLRNIPNKFFLFFLTPENGRHIYIYHCAGYICYISY
jgi:hypothetical protein